MTDSTPDTADFGFRKVAGDARQGLVNEVFARVADRYDLMNDVMSGGLHRLWKDDLVNWLMPPRSATPWHHLDVAGGTGDVALRVMRTAGPNARSIICDISSEMLAAGRRRLSMLPEGRRISLVAGNAETLPFPDRSQDAYTIAFGIRNVTHIDVALREAFRVLKPGGRFLCLEFSEVRVPVLDNLYDAWSFEAIPRLGKLVAGDEESYRYLVESIRRFPNQERFEAMIRAAGFERVQHRNLTGGVAALHSGWRI
ncbi:MAG: bifunctional demethylmenaquinone methyltransferase/2-methoxy-6-polyprenyl-1,4-benzoquinol methylase UbiE [Hyphomicrobiaceae bacterium]